MSKNQELETIIGPSVKIKGNFSSNGNIQIEGILSGSLETSGDIKVGKDAKIQANISAGSILVSGEVTGTIRASMVILTASAKIAGDIETKAITIEEGATFNGKCSMGQELNKNHKKSDSEEDEDQSENN